MYLTVADVLATPGIQAGDPRVRAGEENLDQPVRWVHVSEIAEVAGTLEGGELLLSTGIVAVDRAADLAAYVERLRAAGASGLVIELGRHLPSLPEPMVRTARRLGFPLVELRRTVRFVEITEAVHSRILNVQHERLRFTEQVNRVFTTLTVEGARVDEVLAQAGALSGHPVVLEDLAHHALAHSGTTRPTELLRDWESRSRLAAAGAETTEAGPERWLCTPVGPRRGRWGRLVVPRTVSNPEQTVPVLERAADTLAITRMLHAETHDPTLDAHGGLLRDLLAGQVTDEQATGARLRALGLRPGRTYAVLVLATPSTTTDQALLDAAAATARSQGLAALTGITAPGRVATVFSCTDEPSALRSFLTDIDLPVGTIATAATPTTRLAGLSAALTEAVHIADAITADPTRVGERDLYRSRDLGARGLLWSLRADPRLHQFVELQLHPLLQATPAALDFLRAYLSTNGNIADLARTLHLSRPAVYARLTRLATTLTRDLTDPETRLSLHLAVLAYDQTPHDTPPG
ncbi:PucR family transcriptional regulator [Actinokineospora inagensis]|uniref:PucR family transcriptional regulator n=1 Tax=Actinokineospora inagensis TaxID=103730 RepID=UPI0004795BFC|nr:PucR family transcriptional regulator [Actinokineospora inagensis]